MMAGVFLSYCINFPSFELFFSLCELQVVSCDSYFEGVNSNFYGHNTSETRFEETSVAFLYVARRRRCQRHKSGIMRKVTAQEVSSVTLVNRPVRVSVLRSVRSKTFNGNV